MHDTETIRKKETFDITTDYDLYIAEVTVYYSGRKHIEVYKRPPSNSWLYKTFGPDPKIVGKGIVGKYGDWQACIRRLIFDYEIDLYQARKLRDSDGYLYIDHAEEMKKRRPKKQQQEYDNEPRVETSQRVINDYTKPEPTVIEEQYVITSNGKKVSLKKLLNLKQYEDVKQLLEQK